MRMSIGESDSSAISTLIRIRNPRSADASISSDRLRQRRRRFVGCSTSSGDVAGYGLARIVGIATRRHGGTPRDGSTWRGRTGCDRDDCRVPARRARTQRARAARERRLVVVETTTLDIESGEPAIEHVRAALAAARTSITANKGPAAFAYRALAPRGGARRSPLPVRRRGDGRRADLQSGRETLPAVAVLGFRGVVNSTTNYILTAMEQGQPFEDALAECRRAGIAEADASLDVDGWDAAAKTAALANVLLRREPDAADVERRRHRPGRRGRARVEARAAGRRLKLVARRGATGDAASRRASRRRNCRRRSAGAGSRASRTRSSCRRICSGKSPSCSAAAA